MRVSIRLYITISHLDEGILRRTWSQSGFFWLSLCTLKMKSLRCRSKKLRTQRWRNFWRTFQKKGRDISSQQWSTWSLSGMRVGEYRTIQKRKEQRQKMSFCLSSFQSSSRSIESQLLLLSSSGKSIKTRYSSRIRWIQWHTYVSYVSFLVVC